MSPWKRSLAVLCAAQFLAMLAMSSFMPFLTLYLQRLGEPDGAVAARWSGLLLGAGFLTAALMAPFWGGLADRLGRRKMLLRAMAGSALAVGLMAWARGPWDLLALRVLQGLLGGFVSAATALVAAVSPEDRYGSSVGMLQSSLMAGLIAGPLAGGTMVEAFGFRPMILCASGLILAGALLVAALVDAPPEAAAGGPAPVGENVRAVWSSPVLRTACQIQFLVQMCFVAMHPIMVLFVRELAPGAAREAGLTGLVFGVTAAATVAGAAYFGRRTDRVGAPAVLTLSLAACAALYVPQALARDMAFFLACRAVLGFFVGGIQPSLHGLILRHSPGERRAGILGVTFSGALFGNAVGPVLGGFTAAHLGVRAAFWATGLTLFACWTLSRRLRSA